MGEGVWIKMIAHMMNHCDVSICFVIDNNLKGNHLLRCPKCGKGFIFKINSSGVIESTYDKDDLPDKFGDGLEEKIISLVKNITVLEPLRFVNKVTEYIPDMPDNTFTDTYNPAEFDEE